MIIKRLDLLAEIPILGVILGNQGTVRQSGDGSVIDRK